MPPPRAPEREEDEPLAMSWTIGRVLVVLTVLAMIGFWAWIFAGGPKKMNPDHLDDRAWVDQAIDRCDQLRDDLGKLPNAADLDSADERADLLDRSTPMVAEAIADLRETAPKTGDDAKSLKGWFRDWDTYLGDREDYAKRLRKDDDARFYVTENKELKDSVDKTIEIFTQVNDMRSCATPGDVG